MSPRLLAGAATGAAITATGSAKDETKTARASAAAAGDQPAAVVVYVDGGVSASGVSDVAAAAAADAAEWQGTCEALFAELALLVCTTPERPSGGLSCSPGGLLANFAKIFFGELEQVKRTGVAPSAERRRGLCSNARTAIDEERTARQRATSGER